jgi:hypothetical protein
MKINNRQRTRGLGLIVLAMMLFFSGLMQLTGAFSPRVTPFSPENGWLYFRNGDFQ